MPSDEVNNNIYFTVPLSSKVIRAKGFKKWHQRWWGRLIIIFLAFFLSFLLAGVFYIGRVVILLRSGEISPAQLFGSDSSLVPSTQFSDLAPTSSPSFGRRDAKVVIVEFGDFQCLACKKVQPVVKEILRDYGDKILFVWRDFPVIGDPELSLLTALAGRCANEQGKFWQMQEKLFEAQDQIDETNIKTFSVQIGLNSTQFNDCLISGKYVEKIEEDLKQGYLAGVSAIPTFFINGAKVARAISLDIFEKIIIEELSR